jgi:succinylglutamate desuccinylase
MAYAIFRSDRMEASFNPNAIISGKYLPSATATAIENGKLVLVGALVSGEREVFTLTTPAANSALAKIGIVCTPELMVDERKKNLNEFINAAGDIVRVFMLRSGDVFSVTAEALANATGGTIAVGDLAELKADTKINIVAAGTGITSGSTQVGTIIAIEGSYYVIKVV